MPYMKKKTNTWKRQIHERKQNISSLMGIAGYESDEDCIWISMTKMFDIIIVSKHFTGLLKRRNSCDIHITNLYY